MAGIAAQPPNGVGGIENDAAAVHHLDGLAYVVAPGPQQGSLVGM